MVKQHRDHGAALHDAVRLITLNPARALAIDTTVGSIEPGKQADVTVVGWAGAMPVITRTIRDGREIFVAGYADQ
jgi:alpha-D-ribose 1-methylphosphonate 5-triphosphate diphosphatase